MSEPVVRITDLRKSFKTAHGHVAAVDGVDLEVAAGTTLALVGESGSGKTTLGRCVLGLADADGGRIEVAGRSVRELGRRALREFRRDAQMVFQDPFGSLNPRMRIGTALEEPLLLHGVRSRDERRRRVAATLERVRLGADFAARYPGQLSGGQQQRVGIARALITEPRLIVLDEPTAALDAEVRKGIYELLAELQSSLGLTYLLISHDLASVWGVSDAVAVMHRGRIVEQGSCRDVFLSPTHPYTVALISAAPYVGDRPRASAARLVLAGEEDASADDACRFAGRCPLTAEQCVRARPPLADVGTGHAAACWRWSEATSELADYRAAWSALGAAELEARSGTS